MCWASLKSNYCTFIFVYREDVDYIVTGSVDDLVKIWRWKDDKLELKHALEGHALGVVSVDINSSGTS